MRSVKIVPALIAALAGAAHAEEGPALPELPSTETSAQQEQDNQSLLGQIVVSSTKIAQRGAEVPAVVTVIPGELIEARGYTTLAEVLRNVPGFYDVYDLAFHNFGVRGINGGARASGNIIKLMIDGHPVDYRTTTGNFFGEELIPIELIERVEVIRGPASALYGANAFLGVVNVITKNAGSVDGFHGIGRFTLIRTNPGGGAGFIAGGSGGRVDVVAGLNVMHNNRSNLSLPNTSPDYARFMARGNSVDDISSPRSAFARLRINRVAGGRLTLMASIQNLEAAGEWQDFGPLSHGTKLSLLNQNYVATYDVQPVRRFSLLLSGWYFNGAPTNNERLNIGRDDYVLKRNSAVQGWGLALEAKVLAHRRLTLSFGADFVNEDHTLQTFDQLLTRDVLLPDGVVLRKVGTLIPGEGAGSMRSFRNVGAFAQGIVTITSALTAIAGIRFDYHNIYAFQTNARAGLVYAPPSGRLSLKLLYGSSFKAPSAEQLFTRAITQLDIQGNPTLGAQNAHTFEAYAGYAMPRGLGEISLNVYGTLVLGRVEYVRVGNFLEARNNVDEWVVGGELDSRFKPAKGLTLRAAVSIARTVQRSSSSLLPDDIQVPSSLYPPYMTNLQLDYQLPWWGLHVGGELAYIGARPASQFNVLARGYYELPPYVWSAVYISAVRVKIIPGRYSTLSLNLANVINTEYIEPSFGGIDVPAQGLQLTFRLIQQI